MKRKALAVFIAVLILILTPLFSYADTDASGTLTRPVTSSGTSLEGENEPEIDIREFAKNAQIYCIDTDTVLYSKNADAPCAPLASAKLMCALVAFEQIPDLSAKVEISREMLAGVSGYVYGFSAGTETTYYDLIVSMLIRNANDSALILSRTVCGSTEEFVALMNTKARALGMDSTVYDNPTGLEGSSKTTVWDMILLLKEFSQNEELLKISGTSYTKLASTGVTVHSRNFFLSSYYNAGTSYINKQVLGGIATSSSDSLDTLLTVAKSGSYTYLIALSEAQRTDECIYSYLITNELLSFGASSFEYKTLIDEGDLICSLPVKMGNGHDSVALFPARSVVRYLEKDTDLSSKVSYTYTLISKELTAPVSFGDKAGTLYLYYDGILIEEIDLIIKADITGSSSDFLMSRITEFVRSDLFIKLIITVLGVCLGYILITAVIRGQKVKKIRKDYSDGKK